MRDKEGAMRDLQEHGLAHKRRALQVPPMCCLYCRTHTCLLHMPEPDWALGQATSDFTDVGMT